MIKVSIDAKNLNTEKRRHKATQAAAALKKIVNHPKFKEMILKMPDSHRRTESSKYKTASNQEIYDLFLKGAEEWNEVVDHEIDLIVDDYRSSWFTRNVVGYIIPMKPKIWVNTRHFDFADLKDVVSNFLHEYGHTLGFRHYNADPDGSIPYYLNKVVKALWPIVMEDRDEAEEPSGYWSCPRYRWLPWNWFKRCKWIAN